MPPSTDNTLSIIIVLTAERYERRRVIIITAFQRVGISALSFYYRQCVYIFGRDRGGRFGAKKTYFSVDPVNLAPNVTVGRDILSFQTAILRTNRVRFYVYQPSNGKRNFFAAQLVPSVVLCQRVTRSGGPENLRFGDSARFRFAAAPPARGRSRRTAIIESGENIENVFAPRYSNELFRRTYDDWDDIFVLGYITRR